MALTDFLNADEQRRIEQAIEAAERDTSGEICVHVTRRCKADPVKAAERVFNRLGLYRTRRRNAVLVLVAYESRRFAIIGDSGINEAVPSGFWESEKDTLAAYLAQGRAADGLCRVVAEIGSSLRQYFPPNEVDNNELSNQITYDDNSEDNEA